MFHTIDKPCKNRSTERIIADRLLNLILRMPYRSGIFLDCTDESVLRKNRLIFLHGICLAVFQQHGNKGMILGYVHRINQYKLRKRSQQNRSEKEEQQHRAAQCGKLQKPCGDF